jgi:hypothetical protein
MRKFHLVENLNYFETDREIAAGKGGKFLELYL